MNAFQSLAYSVHPNKGSKKQKISGQLKRARAGLKGLTVVWTDSDPLIDSDEAVIYGDAVSHENPTNRIIIKKVWSQYAHWILTAEFTWLVEVKIVFEAISRGKNKVVEGEFLCTCPLRRDGDSRMNDAIEQFIKEERETNDKIAQDLGADHKSYGVYLRTEFKAKIVGV